MRRMFIALALVLSGCAAPAPGAGQQAETPGMVAAAHPLAVEAGLDVLRAGGSAADAAVAVQAALGLVEPQSSGLGGGAFLIYRDADTGEVTAYDGRETAPMSAGADLFAGPDGQPLGFLDAWTSGRAAGVPGAVAMLGAAQADHGRLDWSALFAAPIALAEDGFAVTPRLHDSIARVSRFSPLDERPATRAYFFTGAGAPLPVGETLRNPAYAQTLRTLRDRGAEAFYEGAIAEAIVEAARAEPIPGALTLEDIAAYAPRVAPALCRPYRVWIVCSAPPPSSGGVLINQALAMLEPVDMSAHGPETAAGWHYLIEALRLAYADRDRYVADPAFADVPTEGLLDGDYLAGRAALIAADSAIATARPGVPPGAPEGAADTGPEAGTSHFVIVDRWGDVVSMTTSVEAAFGSHRMAAGFLLNNQLTDFADDPAAANAPAGGKRPRSSMSPIVVLDRETGAFAAAVGSPGGNSIPSYNLKALVGMLDWGLTPQQAVELPNVVARGDTTRVEQGFDEAILAELRAMGHEIAPPQGENSGLHAVRMLPDGTLLGGADPRREGVAASP